MRRGSVLGTTIAIWWERTQLSPRIAVAYHTPRTKSVSHLVYDRLFPPSARWIFTAAKRFPPTLQFRIRKELSSRGL